MSDSERDDDTTSVCIRMPAEHVAAKVERDRAAVGDVIDELDAISAEFIRSIGPRVTILLVEANARIRAALSRYFAGLDCVVYVCATMVEAEKVMRDHDVAIDYFVLEVGGARRAG